MGLQELKEQVRTVPLPGLSASLTAELAWEGFLGSPGASAQGDKERLAVEGLGTQLVLSLSHSSPCRVPAQAGAMLRVGEPAVCSPTTTTHVDPQEASLKTLPARTVLCLKGPRSLGPLPISSI